MKRKLENDTVLPPAKKQRTYLELKNEPNKNGSVLYEMGLCCQEGENGVEKNSRMAFHHCSEAAQLYYPPALFKLAQYYEQGFGTNKNLERAFQFYSLAAQADYVRAYLPLAFCYHYAHGTDKKPELAFTYFSLAADNGELTGMYMKGAYYTNGIGVQKNLALAFTCFEKASLSGHAEATGALALYYKTGSVVKADLDLAFKYFKFAADKDDLKCLFELSLCYLKGRGTLKNAALAIPALQKAVDKGYAPAQYKLGICFLNGLGTKQNIGRAHHLLKQAADKEHPAALHWMGLASQQDEKKAFTYFQKAAEKGHVKSLYQLGRCYALGLGVECDLVLAFENYKKSAEKNSEAMYQLGHCYKNGHGVAINLELSIECYQAAVQSKPEANKDLYELGLCFLNGEGVKPCFKTAFPLLGTAIKSGFIEAQYHLALYYETVEKNEVKAFKCHEEYAQLKYVEQYSVEFKGDDLGELFCQVAIACKKNKLLTLKYLEQAVQLGNAEAQYRLGDMYSGIHFSDSDSLNVLINDLDIFKSIELYEKSASQGNPVAKSRLDNMEVQFMKGYFFEFIVKDLAKAHDQYTWVAEQLKPGPLLTKTNHFLGRLVEKIKKENPVLFSSLPVKNVEMDINSLIKIADEGSSEAQYTLALYYKDEASKPVKSSSMTFFPGINASDIVRVYSEKANKYFQLAASQGHEKAKTELETMNLAASVTKNNVC